jgi:hypothetical protein
VRKADNLTTSCAVVMKSGNLNFLEPSGPLQACNGTALPHLSHSHNEQENHPHTICDMRSSHCFTSYRDTTNVSPHFVLFQDFLSKILVKYSKLIKNDKFRDSVLNGTRNVAQHKLAHSPCWCYLIHRHKILEHIDMR